MNLLWTMNNLCHARPCCVHPTPILLWQELGAPPVARTVIKASVSSELSLATTTARAWSNVQCARIDGKLYGKWWKMQLFSDKNLWSQWATSSISAIPLDHFGFRSLHTFSILFYPFLNFRSIHAIIDALLPCVARSSVSATQLALRIRAPLSPRARTRQIAGFAQLEPGAAKLRQAVPKRHECSGAKTADSFSFYILYMFRIFWNFHWKGREASN